MRTLSDWLEHRLGHRQWRRRLTAVAIPGGPGWRYVWGSSLIFTFGLQVVTGFCLWTAYSPSVQTAWESVYYVQERMFLGDLIRGLHHYAAQAMVLLLAVHLLRVIIDGAYRMPRELNFWIGLIMMQVVLGMALTGYLLPWDQRGYFATQVVTTIMGAAPLVGPQLQQLVQGGSTFGHHTLTRVFALHAGLLPSLLAGLLVLHLYLLQRHGLTPRAAASAGRGMFWPHQVLRIAVACSAVLGVVLLLAALRGADLQAPADPTEAFSAARPEWYFLFLFRFLKLEAVEACGLTFGAILVPGSILLLLFAMPWIGRSALGHGCNVAVTLLLALAICGLTCLALWEDAHDAEHQAALHAARRNAQRVKELANRPSRIPVTGAVTLLREDPLTQGPQLFARHCAGCHHFRGHDGCGTTPTQVDPDSGEVVAVEPTAPDLGALGSRAWMRRMLVDFETHFDPLRNAPWFGASEGIDPANSEMADWSGDRASLLSADNEENLRAVVEYLVALSGRTDLQLQPELVDLGRRVALEGLWKGGAAGVACTDCHATLDEPLELGRDGGGYPDLAEYLSADWLLAFLQDPGSDQFYGDRNQMPAYHDRLAPAQLQLLVRWLTGDYAATELSDARPAGESAAIGHGSAARTTDETVRKKSAPWIATDGRRSRPAASVASSLPAVHDRHRHLPRMAHRRSVNVPAGVRGAVRARRRPAQR